MTRNGSLPTRTDRLDAIAETLREIRQREDKRRREAGRQEPHDHDHSGRALVEQMRQRL